MEVSQKHRLPYPGCRRLAAAAAPSSSTGKKHPGKAILAGRCREVGIPCSGERKGEREHLGENSEYNRLAVPCLIRGMALFSDGVQF